jgi:hypothetical protein
MVDAHVMTIARNLVEAFVLTTLFLYSNFPFNATATLVHGLEAELLSAVCSNLVPLSHLHLVSNFTSQLFSAATSTQTTNMQGVAAEAELLSAVVTSFETPSCPHCLTSNTRSLTSNQI